MHVCLILFSGMNTILTQGYAKLCNVTLTYFPTQDEKTKHVIENSHLINNIMFLILVNTCLCRVNLDLHNADMSFFWKHLIVFIVTQNGIHRHRKLPQYYLHSYYITWSNPMTTFNVHM